MGNASLMARTMLATITVLTSAHGLATPVNYEITFTQTWLSQPPGSLGYEWLGPRVLSGLLSIDDSVLGASHTNSSYGPNSPELQAIYSFTIALDSKTYSFDQAYTGAIVAPPITSVIQTDAAGTIVDLQGAFTLPGTISSIFLGRDGYIGTYMDVQQKDPVTAIAVSGGTYTVSIASPVPEPAIAWFLGSGLLALSFAVRRRKVISND